MQVTSARRIDIRRDGKALEMPGLLRAGGFPLLARQARQ
jgi:hypothetical protein